MKQIEQNKIRYKDLHWGLKVIVVLGYIYLCFNIVAFLAGFWTGFTA